VISFSSQIFTANQIQQKQIKAGSSFNILTWMQAIAKEKIGVLSVIGAEYFHSRKKILDGSLKIPAYPNSRIWCYDVHDVKFVYELTQHSKWNRSGSPNLLCYCRKGEGLLANHQCELMSTEDHKYYYDLSKEKWDEDVTFHDKEKHRDWSDSENWGVTHFGVSPDDLSLDSIRFDCFHLSCSILRKVMNAVRDSVNSMSTELKIEFTDNVLRTFFQDFHLYCWNCNFSFGRLQGTELFKFLENVELVASFLQRRMGQSERIKRLASAMMLMPRIFNFINTSYIDVTDAQYLKLMTRFEADVREFVRCGCGTFWIDAEDENFYLHALCYYLPVHAKINFERHRLGLGIFTMQGFERRNKESKNCIRRFSTSNRKSINFLVNNIRRLLQVFLFEINAY
jgi:hypothetical protein